MGELNLLDLIGGLGFGLYYIIGIIGRSRFSIVFDADFNFLNFPKTVPSAAEIYFNRIQINIELNKDVYIQFYNSSELGKVIVKIANRVVNIRLINTKK